METKLPLKERLQMAFGVVLVVSLFYLAYLAGKVANFFGVELR